jgi:hypothetical protein
MSSPKRGEQWAVFFTPPAEVGIASDKKSVGVELIIHLPMAKKVIVI